MGQSMSLMMGSIGLCTLASPADRLTTNGHFYTGADSSSCLKTRRVPHGEKGSSSIGVRDREATLLLSRSCIHCTAWTIFGNRCTRSIILRIARFMALYTEVCQNKIQPRQLSAEVDTHCSRSLPRSHPTIGHVHRGLDTDTLEVLPRNRRQLHRLRPATYVP